MPHLRTVDNISQSHVVSGMAPQVCTSRNTHVGSSNSLQPIKNQWISTCTLARPPLYPHCLHIIPSPPPRPGHNRHGHGNAPYTVPQGCQGWYPRCLLTLQHSAHMLKKMLRVRSITTTDQYHYFEPNLNCPYASCQCRRPLFIFKDWNQTCAKKHKKISYLWFKMAAGMNALRIRTSTRICRDDFK